MKPRNNESSLLNVHAVLDVSYANGPGARAVIWTQGCRLHCSGCCNPLTHPHQPRMMLDPQWLGEAMLSIPDVEGVTISGGEPFEQAAAVTQLCRAVRKGGLSVMCYTGWSYCSISQSRDRTVRTLLDHIDMLVDGPFIASLADSHLLWRGSRNQRIRFLTDRYHPDVLGDTTQPQVEGQLSARAPLQVTGFPTQMDLAALSGRLAASAGIVLKTDEAVNTSNLKQTDDHG